METVCDNDNVYKVFAKLNNNYQKIGNYRYVESLYMYISDDIKYENNC